MCFAGWAYILCGVLSLLVNGRNCGYTLSLLKFSKGTLDYLNSFNVS